jgi:hypothetical protein
MKIRTAGDPNEIRTNRFQNKRLEGCSFTSETGRQEITEVNGGEPYFNRFSISGMDHCRVQSVNVIYIDS